MIVIYLWNVFQVIIASRHTPRGILYYFKSHLNLRKCIEQASRYYRRTYIQQALGKHYNAVQRKLAKQLFVLLFKQRSFFLLSQISKIAASISGIDKPGMFSQRKFKENHLSQDGFRLSYISLWLTHFECLECCECLLPRL